MNRIILESDNPADFDALLDFIKKNTNLKVISLGKTKDNPLMEGEPMIQEDFKDLILKAEKEPAITHEVFKKEIGQWIKNLER